MDKTSEEFFHEANSLEYINIETRLAKQAQDHERKLFSKFTNYFDQKFDKMVNVLQDSLQHCERRVATLETKFNLYQQPV